MRRSRHYQQSTAMRRSRSLLTIHQCPETVTFKHNKQGNGTCTVEGISGTDTGTSACSGAVITIRCVGVYPAASVVHRLHRAAAYYWPGGWSTGNWADGSVAWTQLLWPHIRFKSSVSGGLVEHIVEPSSVSTGTRTVTGGTSLRVGTSSDLGSIGAEVTRADVLIILPKRGRLCDTVGRVYALARADCAALGRGYGQGPGHVPPAWVCAHGGLLAARCITGEWTSCSSYEASSQMGEAGDAVDGIAGTWSRCLKRMVVIVMSSLMMIGCRLDSIGGRGQGRWCGVGGGEGRGVGILCVALGLRRIHFGKKSKLAPRYVGSFGILERIGLVAYRLRLPEELSSVHDTFHVSNLKKCLADANLHVPLNEIKIDKTLRFVEEPVEIMDRGIRSLKRSKISLVKVRWNSKRGPEFTWEREDHMKFKYPRLFIDRAVESAS
ncbi:hypothetical protein Tco_0576288 [Tanacetum coccineum]